MPIDTLRLLHRFAGAVALAILLVFQASTIVAETSLSHASVILVKDMIVLGLIPRILCMATAGITGNLIARKPLAGLPRTKANRMKIVAVNGLVILIPAALWLDRAANANAFGTSFYAVQAVEIVAGLLNATLLVLNMRDGLTMTRKKRLRAKQA